MTAPYLLGKELGIPIELQRRIVEQWHIFREVLGVTALMIEGTVVHDAWQLAGTFDRLDKALKPIDTSLGRIPKGKAFIGDIKTGSLVVDKSGAPKWWVKYPVQCVAYADAVPYDTDTDQRGVWDNPPHRKIALIYHYDLARALDGELVEWQAIPVDLQAGRVGGAAALAAKQFRPVFGDPIIISDGVSHHAASSDATGAVGILQSGPVPVASPSEVPCSISTSTAATTPTPEPTTTTPDPTTTNSTSTAGSASMTLTDHSMVLASQMTGWSADTRTRLAAMWPHDTPTPGSVRRGDTTWTDNQLEIVRGLCGLVNAPWDTQPREGVNRWTTSTNSSHCSEQTSTTSVELSALSTGNTSNSAELSTGSSTPSTNTPPSADDGGPLDPNALDALLAACTADDTRMIINQWLAESRNNGCYWNPRIVGTVRSFEQARAARALATMWNDDDTADEFVRCIIEHATHQPLPMITPIGVAIGHLTIGEAQAVCDTVDAINGDRLTLRYSDDGVPQLIA